ncbi:putative lipoprotein NlpE involved in copper resistance [Gelidibacter sediminis]|uniref:Putative lipoprotein NlpE involved in copper resistance n=1 Tax=Gelidibacter sediminis TaxID=1608710 RepID=A0A4R7Q9P4_9FLAO|nr:copper resistance protein NlpE N-terminal domain-containing protein [Gelidibacter sediminis]TDU43679.1 putative lipoprotein NlpE involved in copper resistance [Gelidibacter sediminis]
MKKTLINSLFAAVLVMSTACNSGSKKDNQAAEASETEAMADNSRTSLDWEGTYEGVVPCADCEGIKTVVTINDDNTYMVKETYLGAEPRTFESKGTFKWDDEGQRLVLSDSKRNPYFVGENTLTLLDAEGNRPTGELKSNYVLKKVTDQLVGEKWHLVSFRGDKIQLKEVKGGHPFVQFSDDFTLHGYTGCNDLQGGYEVGDALKLKFSNLINTLKSCPEMETENQFIKIMTATRSYAFEDRALVMYDENHLKLATFKAAN